MSSLPIRDDFDAVDYVLKQGSAEELAAARARLERDPFAALAVAETVALVEHLRELRVEPSQRFHAGLYDVVLRASRRQPRPPARPASRRWRDVVVFTLAATTTFALLWLGRSTASTEAPRTDLPLAGVGMVGGVPGSPLAGSGVGDGTAALASAAQVQFQETLDQMRRRLAVESPSLRAEFEAGLLPGADPLGRWLDPRNALAELRIHREGQSDPRVRELTLRRAGAMDGLGRRLTTLSTRLAADVQTAIAKDDAPVAEVARAVRAILAAGGDEPMAVEATRAGATWLADRLEHADPASLVEGLAALWEVAAVRGHQVDAVVRHGERLLDELLVVDAERWGRRLPDLLSPRTPAGVLAEAGRVLAFLPGFGLPADRCTMARRLALGQLRDRLPQDAQPDVLAALGYGFADLLTGPERQHWSRQLQRWHPARLVPDFTTVQHVAWGVVPGDLGYTEVQARLRRLAVLPEPGDLGARASFCLALAAGCAAYPMPALGAQGE